MRSIAKLRLLIVVFSFLSSNLGLNSVSSMMTYAPTTASRFMSELIVLLLLPNDGFSKNCFGLIVLDGENLSLLERCFDFDSEIISLLIVYRLINPASRPLPGLKFFVLNEELKLVRRIDCVFCFCNETSLIGKVDRLKVLNLRIPFS